MFFALLAFLGVIGLAVGGYWYLGLEQTKYQEQLVDFQNELAGSNQQLLAKVNQKTDRVAKDLKSQQQAAKQDATKLQQVNGKIRSLEQNLAAQNKRISAVANTSREDWLLAEAEYLLKLANQRVQIEKSHKSADALLVEADRIVMSMADPDLFYLRESIAKDLTALRLVKKVDQEGIYQRLNALAEKVEVLPTHVAPDKILLDERTNQTNETTNSIKSTKSLAEEETKGWIKKISDSFSQFMQGIGRYIRLTQKDVKAKPSITPELGAYAKQNLRLIISRAQIALLREQPQIFAQTIDDGMQWINDYFPQSETSDLFIQQLALIQQENIVLEMPDISHSLELMRAYIAQLHELPETPNRGVKK